MGIENVALAMLKHQQDPNNQECLRPALIAGTGAGKTTMVNDLAVQLAEYMGEDMPTIRILLSQQLPEDLGGWPMGDKESMKFKIMDELHQATKKPAVLFLDEFDKVRPDVMGTVLTLLYEKRIRNYKLHPKTVIICAMQPVNPSIWLADETGKAMAARMTFLPINYRWGYIEQKFCVELPHLREREKGVKIELPVMPATPRTLDCVLSFLRSTHGMNLNREEKRMILYGTIAKGDAEVLESVLNKSIAWVNPVEAAKIDPIEAIDSLDVHTLTQHAGPLMEVIDPKAWKALLKKVWIQGTVDDTKATLQGAFDYLKGKCEASSNKQVKVFGDATPEEIVKATKEAAEEIAAVWSKQKESKEKK